MKLFFIFLMIAFFSTTLSANCENKFFTFTIKESEGQSISIMDVLENISDECKMTIVFEDGSVRKVLDKKLNYINAEDYSLKDLLDLILSENNIFYELKNHQKILKVANFKTKMYFIDYVSFSERKSSTNKVIKTGSSGDGEDSTTMDFVSEFKFWEKISEDVGYILYRDEDNHKIQGKVLINQEGGMLTVTGTKKQLTRVKKYITSLMGRLHKEILLEAKIIEVMYADTQTQGIDWSQFQLSVGANSNAMKSRQTGLDGIGTLVDTLKYPNYMINYNFEMEGMINFLKTQGDINVVSNPKVMTLNNQPAVINVGTEINYRFQTDSTTDLSSDNSQAVVSYENDSTFVGVTLDITPQVTKDDYIILKINPVISELADKHLDENGIPILAPDIKIKQFSSIVKVKNNHKVIIGGLIGKDETLKDTSVPFISDIPLIGRAFKSNARLVKKGELIIIITPRIVDGIHTPTLDDIDEKYKKEAN